MCGALKIFEPVLRWVPFVTHWQLIGVLWLQPPILRALARLLSQMVPPMLQRTRREANSRTEAVEARTPRATHSTLLAWGRR